MHHKVKTALEELDAAVFSGDTFEDYAARRKLFDYVNRWIRELCPLDELEEKTPGVLSEHDLVEAAEEVQPRKPGQTPYDRRDQLDPLRGAALLYAAERLSLVVHPTKESGVAILLQLAKRELRG